MNKNSLIESFNQPDSLLILSSFPGRKEEIAMENAVSRYTYLLAKHFPRNKKVVVFCEIKNEKSPYKLASNILVVPTYKVNSPLFAWEVNKKLSKFSKVSNLLIQFEFSIFGGKISIPGVLGILAYQRLTGRNISIMFHQVVANLNALSGHLGLTRNGVLVGLYTKFLRIFYVLSGEFADTVLVHDQTLKTILARFTKADKIEIVPHGTASFSQVSGRQKRAFKASLEIKENEKVILAFGYFSWYKGTDWLVKVFAKWVKSHPETKYKLVLGGGESPTLKNTSAYKRYIEKLYELTNKCDGRIVITGFIPESDVSKIFSVADAVIFPYRTKMSASGALALAWGYGKSVLISEQFAENFKDADVSDALSKYSIDLKRLSFKLSSEKEFGYLLANLLDDRTLKLSLKFAGQEISTKRSWTNTAIKYLEVCSKKTIAVSPSVREDEIAYAYK